MELARFSCLVLSLPTLSPPVNVRRALEPFAAVAAAYRGHWPHGLPSLLDGTVEALDAGVLQMFGEAAVLHNPAIRTAYKKACFVQITDHDPVVDVLAAYQQATNATSRPTPWAGSDDIAADLIEQTWRYVRVRNTPTAIIRAPSRPRCPRDSEVYGGPGDGEQQRYEISLSRLSSLGFLRWSQHRLGRG